MLYEIGRKESKMRTDLPGCDMNDCKWCTSKNCIATEIRRISCPYLHYTDLAEQGRLVELPVPIGTEVWKIAYQRRGDEIYCCDIQPCIFNLVLLERFGDTVFKTRAEAQARLEELEGEK